MIFKIISLAPFYLEEAGVNLASTPLIEDLDSNGFLDFVYAYRADSLNPMAASGFLSKLPRRQLHYTRDQVLHGEATWEQIGMVNTIIKG